MVKRAQGSKQPAKLAPKRLNADILDESNGMRSFKRGLGAPEKPKSRNILGNQQRIQATGFAQRQPIKLNPKYTFNLKTTEPSPGPGKEAFLKKPAPNKWQRFSDVSKKHELPAPKYTYVYGQHAPKQLSSRTPIREGSARYSSGVVNAQSPIGTQTGVNSRKRVLYVNREKSRTEGSERLSKEVSGQKSFESSRGQSGLSHRNSRMTQGPNRSVLTSRTKSPTNPLKTLVFVDTSTTSPRKIRLPNSTRPDFLEKGPVRRAILSKATFVKKSAKKVSADLIAEDGDKVPSKTRFRANRKQKSHQVTQKEITGKIIDELVSENQLMEKEYRANSQVRKQRQQREEAEQLRLPKLDTSSWGPVEAVNINNINSFGLDRHDRFPTGHKFSLNAHRPNDTGQANWLVSTYKTLFGKEQHKNSEFTVPRELRSYQADYQLVRPEDLRFLLVREQIEGQFDRHLLRALMEWTPQRTLEDSFERLKAQKAFGNSENKVRRADQSKIKAVYWAQPSEGTGEMGAADVRRLQKLMKDARDTLSIIRHSARAEKFRRRNQDINFSPEELRKVFEDSSHGRMAFFFRKYRGILGGDDVEDNVLFIEGQLHGVADQLSAMTLRHRQRNQGRESLFRRDSEGFSKRAAVLLKKVLLMRETMRVAKKVG